MTAINPAAILSQLADNEPAATHTYILNGIKHTDTYTAGEIKAYLFNGVFPPGTAAPGISTGTATKLVDKYIF